MKRVVIFTIVFTLAMTCGQVFAASSDKAGDTIKEGIYIENINVGGMTAKEAEKAVAKEVKLKTETKVSLQIGSKVVDTTLGELGYEWLNKGIVDEAISTGKTGNIIKRYEEELYLKKKSKKYDLKIALNEKKLKSNIEKICEPFESMPKNASLKATGNGFQVVPGKEGVVIDLDTTIKGFKEQVYKKWDGSESISFVTTTKVAKPKYTTEDCEKVSNTPMGSYTTYFSTGVVNRNLNIKNGAEKINGSVIYPGESYSCNEHLVPWTEDNGWKPAGTYVDGGVSDSLGGGICQVSSTLYNALLKAEIKITERYPHSMAVSYVPLSADAALAGDYKDLVFENNTDAPIYIQGIYTEGAITFNVYGHDTRKKGHSVKYVSKTISTTPIKTKTQKDSTKSEGYREVIPGHVGYVAELYKITYENGKEVSKELVHTSTYRMSPTTTIIGTKKKKDDSKKDDKKSKDETSKASKDKKAKKSDE